MSFIFGGDTGQTYEDIKRKRDLVQALMMKGGAAPRNVGEGLNAVGQALMVRGIRKRTDAADAERRKSAAEMMAGLYGGGGGGVNPYVATGGGAGPVPGNMTQNEALAAYGGPTKTAAAAVNFGDYERQHNLPEGYLQRTAQIESNMGKNMDNPNSSAGGPFQFIDSTAKEYGLADKYDWAQSTDAASRLAADNATALRRVLGRDPTGAELYLAHQQGGGGAAKLLANPNARAVDVVGAEAVRLNGGNADMTAGQFAGLWMNKFGGQGSTPTMSAQGSPTRQADTGPTVEALMQAMSSGVLSPQQEQLAGLLLQQKMQQRQQANDPMRQMQMQKAEMELELMRNPPTSFKIEQLSDGRKYYVDPSGRQAPRPVNPDIEPPKGATPLVTPEERAAWGIPETDTRPYAVKPGEAPKVIGGAGQTINNNMPGSDKFAEAFATGDAKTLSTITEIGIAARRNIGRIDKLEELLNNSPSGAGAALQSLAGQWGIKTEGLTNIQAAEAIISSLVPEQREPGSGTMSDADLKLFKQSLPQIINQPGGNQIIIDTIRGIAQYDAEGAQIVQSLRAGEITRAQAFDALQNRKNPLSEFKAALPPSGAAAQTNAPAPNGLSPEDMQWLEGN